MIFFLIFLKGGQLFKIKVNTNLMHLMKKIVKFALDMDGKP